MKFFSIFISILLNIDYFVVKYGQVLVVSNNLYLQYLHFIQINGGPELVSKTEGSWGKTMSHS